MKFIYHLRLPITARFFGVFINPYESRYCKKEILTTKFLFWQNLEYVKHSKRSDQMVKQAVILAAGKGTRMKADIPKPLLKITNNELIIERNIKKLIKQNADVCLVINPKFEALFREKLNEYNLKYCHQQEPLGTGNALYAAKNFVKNDLFFVMMGDDFVEFDIQKALSIDRPTVFGYEVEDVSGYGTVKLDKDGSVIKIIEKENSGKGIVNSGVYIMPKAFFEHYDELINKSLGTEQYLTHAIEILSSHGVQFNLEKLDNWHGINTPDDLLDVNRKLGRMDYAQVRK
jgi:NDP-sugar pyrophosphorylase family protein